MTLSRQAAAGALCRKRQPFTNQRGEKILAARRLTTGAEETMADQLAADIIARIAGHTQPEVGPITRQTELSELGIHSLELTEIIFDIEDHYGIEVEMNTTEAWNNLRNVGDIVDAVHKLIDAK